MANRRNELIGTIVGMASMVALILLINILAFLVIIPIIIVGTAILITVGVFVHRRNRDGG